MLVAKLHIFCVIIFRATKQLHKFALFYASLHAKDVCMGGKGGHHQRCRCQNLQHRSCFGVKRCPDCSPVFV